MADLVLVDDDQDLGEMLAALLRDEGHVVRLAGDGKAGLALIHQRLPGLLLLDVEMPVLSGPDLVDLLLLQDCGKENIPVILLSGVVSLREVAARVGTPYFLAKPYDISDVLALVERALTERIFPRSEIPHVPAPGTPPRR